MHLLSAAWTPQSHIDYSNLSLCRHKPCNGHALRPPSNNSRGVSMRSPHTYAVHGSMVM